MGVYMVIEGKRTEKKLYGAWFKQLFPAWQQVNRVEDVAPASYFIIAGKGYPQYKDRIKEACADVRNRLGNVHHLFVCVDAEEITCDERLAEISALIDVPGDVHAHVIVQDCCIETWLLGNRKLISPNSTDLLLQQYLRHFNIREDDPEIMPCHPDFNIRSRYHFAYLRQAFRAKGPDSFTYTKYNPGHAAEESYLRALVQRHADTGHLFSFGRFCDSLRILGATL